MSKLSSSIGKNQIKIESFKNEKTQLHPISESKEVEANIKGSEDIQNKKDEINESVISGYIIPKLSENDIAQEGKASPSIITYFNDKIKFLEAENKNLINEIANTQSFSEKEKISYYLRLRKELVEENEKLVSNMKNTDLSHTFQVQKYKSEIKHLKDELYKYNKAEDNIGSDRTLITSINQQFNSPVSSTKKESFVSNSKFFGNLENEVKLKENPVYLEKLLEEIKSKQTGPRNSVYKLDKKDHNNPFIPVIDDLEERVKLLTQTIKEKECDIMELNEVISTNEQIAKKSISQLQTEIVKWKEKYLLILATRKTISQEFSDLNIKATENIKNSLSKITYDMESKVLLLEKLNDKLNFDMKAMTKADTDIETQKTSEISNLKRDLKNLMENYDDLYRNYEDSLTILTKQIDSIKQLYLARENEFIEVTNYYVNSLNDYSKPLLEINGSQSNLKQLEDSLIAQSKQSEEMRRVAEKFIKENSLIKSENFESKAVMRQKINDAIEYYDNTISNISTNHTLIETKLDKIIVFMENFDSKLTFFNSLIEDKKNLIDKVCELETKLSRINSEDDKKEILSLRQMNMKLSKELESKLFLLKEMEEIQENIFKNKEVSNIKTKNIIKVSGNFNNSFSPNRKSIVNINKEVSMETINKMKLEIATLSSKVFELKRSKAEIEDFYQDEMKKLMCSLEERNEHIYELMSLITKNENAESSKKETIFNLWMIEFKEFKENLIGISDIKSTIDKFKVDGKELKIQRDKLISEEIYILRQEIKTKDKSITDLKLNYQNENKVLNELISTYKKGAESRLETLDKLINTKSNEINALKNDRKRMEQMEKRKKEVLFLLS